MRLYRLLPLLMIPLAMVTCSVRTAKLEGEGPLETRMLEGLLRYNDGVSTLDARAVVIYKDENIVLSFRASVVVDGERMSFRLDLADFVFNKPILTIIKSGEQVLAVVHHRREYYLLSYDELDLQKLAGFSIPKELLLSSMMGKVYVAGGNREVSRVDSFTLRVKTAGMQSKIHFREDWLPDRVLFISSLDTYELFFTKFEASRTAPFPLKITLKNSGRMLTVTYSEPSINVDVGEESFLIGTEGLEEFRRANL